jgi:hypothetical protein
MQQFVSDAHTRASASDAEFLRLGSVPLSAGSLPVSSCQ